MNVCVFLIFGTIRIFADLLLPPQRGGAHLGSITVTGAQIGRQQRSERTPTTDEEKEYRHAFLIVEAKKGPGGNHPRHVLCAESDEDRDSWVEILVRYFSGTYSEEPLKYGASPIVVNTAFQNGAISATQPRSSTSSHDSPSSRRPTRGLSKDDISISKGAAVPISQLPPDYGNAKLFQPAPLVIDKFNRSSSPAKSVEPSPTDRQATSFDTQNFTARRILERGQGQPSSLPDSSPLSAASHFPAEPAGGPLGQRANSELGHYPDLQDSRGGRNNRQVSPERHRTRDPHDKHKSFYPTLNTVASSPTTDSPVDRIPSPDKLDVNSRAKVISGPINGAPIPSGFKFGGKDAPSASESTAAERREKAKSRSFWGFGKANGTSIAFPDTQKLTACAGDKANQPVVTYIPRAVFGVTLDEALDVAQIANLPAIVFRAIQYLEAKKADQEEGIYRLSGSSAVIKSLKDRFNMGMCSYSMPCIHSTNSVSEGDVDLLASDEYWDPHAIAGLLKSFLRELPASILTRDLHLKFLAVIGAS
jgi:RalA-binding protein 1